MTNDSIYTALAVLCLIIGFVGSVLPALPGAPLAYAGLLILHFTNKVEFSLVTLVSLGLLTVATLVIDYVLPGYFTKKTGGSNYGSWGATIGMLIGAIFFNFLGIILGPLVGAFIGEIIHDRQDVKKATKAAFAAFVAFFISTGLKLVVCLVIAFFFIKELVHY